MAPGLLHFLSLNCFSCLYFKILAPDCSNQVGTARRLLRSIPFLILRSDHSLPAVKKKHRLPEKGSSACPPQSKEGQCPVHYGTVDLDHTAKLQSALNPTLG